MRNRVLSVNVVGQLQRYAWLRSCALVLVCGGALGVASCSASSTEQQGDAAKGPAGALAYAGVVTGKAQFQTADCTFGPDKKLIAFTSPHQDENHPEAVTPGPLLNMGFADPGTIVNFTSDHASSTPANTFLRMNSNQGITWGKQGEHWVVTLKDVRLSNQDLMNQKSVVLNGTFNCTHITH